MSIEQEFDVRSSLVNFQRQFNELIDALEKPGYDQEWVKEKYRDLKENLKEEIRKAKNIIGTENEPFEIEAFYYPALNEAFLELKVKTNTSPSKKMFECLVSAEDYISYYLLQMNKK